MPLVHSSPPRTASSPGQPAPGAHEATVLVVGDLGEDSDHIAWLLQISGYHAAIVPDAASAEMFLTRHRPSLIVAPLRHMAWYSCDPLDELLETLLAARPTIRVLLISDEAVDARSETKSGVVEGILPHPLDAGKFCSAVHRAINRSAPHANRRAEAP